MAFPVGELVLAVVLILAAVLIFHFLKNLFVNTVMGVLALLALNLLADYAKYSALKIPITFVTVLISALLGLAGVGLLILLKLLGVNTQ